MASGTQCAGKVVVVTGGGQGIGAGIVKAFVDSGAQVVFCDKDEAGGRALEQELPGTVFIACDVTREGELQTLISETLSRFGHLDCVVNNAGYHPPAQWPLETSLEGFRQLLEVNLLGMYTLTKPQWPGIHRDPPVSASLLHHHNRLQVIHHLGSCIRNKSEMTQQLALPHLRKSRGNIINISSLVGAIGQSQAVPYVATKGAVTAMTKALALDESQYGVRVNCISPGNIWTPLWKELAASTPDPRATILEGTLAQPLGRMGQPAEVGAAAVFLASEATFCTGLELLVTGGAELGYGRKASPGTPCGSPHSPSLSPQISTKL